MMPESIYARCRDFSLGVFPLVVIACCLSTFSGCGSNHNVGYVSGVVTLDGVPVKAATVAFSPSEGRGSSGVTDDQGRYKLRYLADEDGALIGNHKVTVSTKVYGKEGNLADSDDSDDLFAGGVQAQPETIPSQYSDNRKTVLTADVKAGTNECDFALDSAM